MVRVGSGATRARAGKLRAAAFTPQALAATGPAELREPDGAAQLARIVRAFHAGLDVEERADVLVHLERRTCGQ